MSGLDEAPRDVGVDGDSADVGVDGDDDRPSTPGIHHVSTVAGDPFENRRFFTAVLGMRLTKRTVNFDEPYVYHLYYGDSDGTPGTTFTYFPYPLDDGGRVGAGQPTEVALTVPAGSLDDWAERLRRAQVDVERDVRFGDPILRFSDPDGLPLTLVESRATGVVGLDERPVDPWTGGDPPVEPDRAIRGVHSVTLDSANPFATARVLEVLGFGLVGEAGDRVRYVAGQPIVRHEELARSAFEPPTPATVVDVLDHDSEWGKEGAGTGHHVAFRVPDRAALDAWYDRLVDAGLSPSRPKDRHYFESVYVRDPGGVLFELATDGPGLTRDEGVTDLGTELRLPPWLADDEAMIRAQLPPLDEPVERGDVTTEARR